MRISSVRKLFLVEALDTDEIRLRLGPGPATPIRIAFDALPSEMARYGGDVPLGTKAAQGTLEGFLRDRHGDGTIRAQYAAPVLVEGGVYLFLPRQAVELQRIGLRPGWSRCQRRFG